MFFRKSSKRATPVPASRRISMLQASPSMSSACSIGQILISQEALVRIDALMHPEMRASCSRRHSDTGDRKRVGEGKSVSVRVDLGVRRLIKKQNKINTQQY